MSNAKHDLGVVTQTIEGGEPRDGQANMTEGVAVAVKKRAPYLVEAGTGTGKSLAYLVPALTAKGRTVVATATIALQSQLLNKDIPQVVEALDLELVAAMLKGRSNYVCVQRLAELDRAKANEQRQLLRGSSPGEDLARVKEWAGNSATGDKEELDPAPPHEVWRAVSVGADECPGAAKCPSGESCFSEQARNLALAADVIVTNHHYYGINIATGGELFGEHEIAIFDEAHHLPEVLGATCGTELSGSRMRAIAARVRGLFTDETVPAQLEKVGNDLDRVLAPQVGQIAKLTPDLVAIVSSARERSNVALNSGKRLNLAENSDAKARLDRVLVTLTSLVDDIDRLLLGVNTDVVWVDGNDERPVLRQTPLDVGDILTETLWPNRSVILTSATLPDSLPAQLGLDDSHQIDRVGSPFNYEEQGMLYCATKLCNPSQNNFRSEVQAEMETLINAAGGRTLGLFTSSAAMIEASNYLTEALDFPVLVQGESSKQALIERFIEVPESVLLATMSFWQGVDIPGDSLTLVTIDRIPFPRPDDPVTMAKRDRSGRYAFRDVDLPRAQILLAQGAGRLIRRSDDKGVVAVLDSRLSTRKSYRWQLINAMPPFKRTADRDQVCEYLASLNAGASSSN